MLISVELVSVATNALQDSLCPVEYFNVWNRRKSTFKPKSIRVSPNQGTAT